MHLHKLRKKGAKLFAAGCGCTLLLSLGIGIIVVVSSTGFKARIYGYCTSAWSLIPKQIQLPQEVKLPAELGLPESIKLPQLPDLFALSPQEQILLGNEVAQRQGFEAEAFIDARIDSVGCGLSMLCLLITGDLRNWGVGRGNSEAFGRRTVL
jgi:hypothetical protein